ncbi:tRNA adenosine(34) deaminase TadA [Selenomonas sp. TAMA-11512]|uniref:tRNA adenosine(34) deaminase TadA n=1 Tax=Selenomonas sp. TAMA-11512 TaxID=3095337 RepID=UPI003093C6B7|nr:tRNA adenosine(34) deaminase TadA [Selenomonas sp. TAMA-11512]
MWEAEIYMRAALAEAKAAFAMGEVPVGAVIVDDRSGDIVARGHNMRETWRDATAHAEVIAIREACKALERWRLSGCSLYVTVEPCPMCAGALLMSRVDRLFYGVPDSKAGGCESIFNIVSHPRLNHRLEVTAGVLEEECRELLKAFFQTRRGGNEAVLYHS